MGYFSKSEGHDWAFDAEVKAILHAFLFCQHFLLTNVLIENYSTIVVGWVLSKARRPHVLLNLFILILWQLK